VAGQGGDDFIGGLGGTDWGKNLGGRGSVERCRVLNGGGGQTFFRICEAGGSGWKGRKTQLLHLTGTSKIIGERKDFQEGINQNGEPLEC